MKESNSFFLFFTLSLDFGAFGAPLFLKNKTDIHGSRRKCVQEQELVVCKLANRANGMGLKGYLSKDLGNVFCLGLFYSVSLRIKSDRMMKYLTIQSITKLYLIGIITHHAA